MALVRRLTVLIVFDLILDQPRNVLQLGPHTAVNGLLPLPRKLHSNLREGLVPLLQPSPLSTHEVALALEHKIVVQMPCVKSKVFAGRYKLFPRATLLALRHTSLMSVVASIKPGSYDQGAPHKLGTLYVCTML